MRYLVLPVYVHQACLDMECEIDMPSGDDNQVHNVGSPECRESFLKVKVSFSEGKTTVLEENLI